ncbi:MAG: Eco57I restriction-modification methylase domain-containing protein [Pirellulales bacterium]
MMDRDHPVGIELIERLVQGFRANYAALRDPGTLEAVVRLEYLDPFWEALGWDVGNRLHRSHAEKDVLVEAPVATIEQERVHARRPDYLFRIDGFPRFVVEAKKPSVGIGTDKDAIFQAKTYAWSSQIPFVILTDFAQFRLFDATIKPYHGEPDRGLIEEFDLGFDDYAAQWDVLWSTFGREAVAAGSLERLLAKIKHVRAGRRIRGIDRTLCELRGTEPVDRVFLAHLEDSRLRFARALYERNRTEFPDADTRHGAARLTEATQRLIDRLVFMRVCEDRDVIAWGQLRETVNEAAEHRLDLYAALLTQFREFDSQYNGYLFKPHFNEQLQLPAQLLADFIRSLYPPEGPYRFDAIGDDLLGIIYERFLGGAMTVQKGQVLAEEKPEVRHAGGVYYTPRFVVDAIIRRVVGPKVEGKTPLQVLDVKILDPACGSGSFLIAATQYLMDHCLRYIAEHPKAAEAPSSAKGSRRAGKVAFKNRDGGWSLTPEFKARILTSCIYGVDIDAQAVEVTIMSLYLKALEGGLPRNWQRELQFGRLLPPLDNNICCGNSLLSQADFDDWWENRHGALFAGDADVRFRMNPFDWASHTRGFGRLLAERSGFDCVIGNPPYIRVQELNKWAPDECEFYKSRYQSAKKGNYDIYVVFLERALELLAADGVTGFICPHKFWQAAYGSGIRKLLADGRHLESVIDFTDQQVFHGATTYTAIHVLSKTANSQPIRYARITELVDGDAQCRALDNGGPDNHIDRFPADPPAGDAPWVFVNSARHDWLQAVRSRGPALGEITAKIAQGLVSGCDEVFYLERSGRRFRSHATGSDHEIERALLHPLLKGSLHIRRWLPTASPLVVLFPYKRMRQGWVLIPPGEMAAKYPKAWDYLSRCRKPLEQRERGRFAGDDFHQFSRPQNFGVMAQPKLLVPSIGTRGEFCLDSEGEFFFVGSGGGGGGGYAVVPSIDIDLAYLCGLLNSKVLDAFLKSITTRFHSGWYAYSKLYLAQLPIKIPETAAEKKHARQVVERVLRIVEVKKSRAAGNLSDRERERLEREAESHEQGIDKIVAQLYGVDESPDE